MKNLNLFATGLLALSVSAAVAQNDSTTVRSTTVTETRTEPTYTPAPTPPPPPAPAPAATYAPSDKQPDHYFRGLISANYMPTFSMFDVRNSRGDVIQSNVVMSNGWGAAIGITGKYVGLQLEAIYNQMSQKYRDNNVDHRVDINYVNIPLLLVLNTNKSRIFNVNVAAGPQLGINVGSSITNTGSSNNSETYQGILAVKKSDFGIAYGAGIDIALDPARRLRLGLGFRGVLGLVDISDQSYTRATNQYLIVDRTHTETYAGYAGLTFLF